MSVIELLPPPGPQAEPALSQEQERVLSRIAAGGHGVVTGPPGCGRTTVAVHALVRALQAGADPAEVVLLAPSRIAAATLRNRVAALAQVAVGAPVVASPQSLAFRVLRLHASALGQPTPTMISGAEQDGILATMLAGHQRGEGRPIAWPPSIPASALGVRALRDELRDVFMRAAEGGWDPEDLEQLAVEWAEPGWRAAAQLYDEYRGITSLPNTGDSAPRYDPAAAMDEATVLLATWETAAHAAPPRWRLVLVDDFQDATVGTMRFLRQLASDGAQVVMFSAPDLGVQGYRGGEPGLAARMEEPAPSGMGAWCELLTTGWRQGPVLAQAVGAVVSHIRGPAPQWRHGTCAQGLPEGQVQAVVMASHGAHMAWLADVLRRAHLLDGTDYSQMAVLTRSAGQVQQMADGLRLAGVPVDVPATDLGLRAESVVRPFLEIIRVAAGDREVTADLCAELLASPIGGHDAVATRRLRRALSMSAAAAPGGTGNERADVDVLVAALVDGVGVEDVDRHSARGLRRVRAVLRSAHEAMERPGCGAAEALWGMWVASGLAEAWRATALAGGPGAARADRDLDVMLALFKAAERFSERMPGAGPLRFVDSLDSEDLPSDSLSARAWHEPAVSVLTATSAVGRQWQVVVVAGLQEDVWPDLRLRDTALSARLLTDISLDRAVRGGTGYEERRRAILDDELRFLAMAASRASHRLILSAVSDADTRPSAFLDLPGVDVVVGQAPPMPFDLRGMVADARHTLMTQASATSPQSSPPPVAAAAAALLHELAEHAVPGALPQQWAGVIEPSVAVALHDSDDAVTLSPSRVEALLTCPLRWLFETSGGRAPASDAQEWGTFIHELARLMAAGLDWRAEAERGVARLASDATWQGRRDRDRLRDMIRKLDEYHQAHPDVLGAELKVSAQVEGVAVRGRVDRLERTSHGVRVVDFKTGASAPTIADAAVNPQLGVYQVAIEEGTVRPSQEDSAMGVCTDLHADGAALVYLGTSAKGATERSQPPLSDSDHPDWARDLLREARSLVRDAQFQARAGTACTSCAVAGACPVVARGEQVTT